MPKVVVITNSPIPLKIGILRISCCLCEYFLVILSRFLKLDVKYVIKVVCTKQRIKFVI